VALVVQELRKVESWDILDVINEVPAGLEELYRRMIGQIQLLGRKMRELCRGVLAAATAMYRPPHLAELRILSGLPPNLSSTYESVAKIVDMCGSFLTIRDNIVYTIHQSAQEFLSADTFIFPSGIQTTHYTLFLRSLEVMSRTLRHDVFSLRAPGISIDQVKQPDPDPLAVARYSCLYWVDHLLQCNTRGIIHNNFKDDGSVYNFLSTSYLYWLEALSLMKSLPDGIVLIMKLEGSLQVSYAAFFEDITRDSRTNLTRPIKVLIYTHLYMMQRGSLCTTDQSLNRRPFNHIAQHLSSAQRRVLLE
jgi:hypothetical protein